MAELTPEELGGLPPQVMRYFQVANDIHARTNWLAFGLGCYLTAPAPDARRELRSNAVDIVKAAKLAPPAIDEIMAWTDAQLRQGQ